MLYPISRVVDLLDPDLNRIVNMDVEDARARVLSGDPSSVRAIDGSFALVAQEGRTVRMADFRGKVLAIDFIYTRCPLPDVCPLLSANFAALSRHFAKELGSELVLVSVTVDPEYDTPAVLAAYAKRWRADANGWRFLTGDVAKLAGALGEVYWSDEGSIGHNSTTSIIGSDGHLAAVVDGSGWRLEQMQYLIANAINSAR